MVFSRTVDCDRIDETDEPSLLWKLPLLLLALVLQHQGHNPPSAAQQLFCCNCTNFGESSSSSSPTIKWQPSLETIPEEAFFEDELELMIQHKPAARPIFATWQTAFVWSAVWFLSYRKQQSLLDVLVMT